MTETRPPLSVVVPARDGIGEVAPVLDALLPQAERVGAEVLVVGGPAVPVPEGPVRHLPDDHEDLLRLRARALVEARGEIVAIGEDHAVPTPGWCDAVIRAHAERPEAAVVGCLINATDRTVAGRANFLAFAAPWQPPMAVLPEVGPPPCSTLSLKRAVLEGLGDGPGGLESQLMPQLFEQGGMVADERVVVLHHQDHGIRWSIANKFHDMRSGYGYAREHLTPGERRKAIRWVLGNAPKRYWRGAVERRSRTPRGWGDLAIVALIAAAAGLGGVVGLIAGPGRSPDRVA